LRQAEPGRARPGARGGLRSGRHRAAAPQLRLDRPVQIDPAASRPRHRGAPAALDPGAAALAVLDVRAVPRIRLLLSGLLCAGTAYVIVRLGPAAAASWRSRRAALRLESVHVITRAGAFPLVEITLRNPAPSISFLTTLDVEVTKRLHRVLDGACSGGPVSWDYDL